MTHERGVEGAYVPKSCTWELTRRCNLDCRHCGSRAGRPRGDEMDRSTAVRVMGELAALGCEKVTLSGGEPTLSPHWEAVAEEGTRLGVRMNMITNGLRADRAFVRRAKDAGLRGLGVSLDGLEEAHDQLRGRQGMFCRVNEVIDACNAEKLPVGVITTIWKGNVGHLDELAELLAGRVYVWQVQLGESMGNMLDHGVDMVTPRDLLELIPTLARFASDDRVPIRVADNVGYFGPFERDIRSLEHGPKKVWGGCKAGLRHLGIEADGGVKGCLSLQAVETTEGNLKQEALADIWFAEGAFAYNREFTVEDLAGFCRRCRYAELCRGGCYSARTCEGGVENTFCYHRVDVLSRRRSVRQALTKALAPAAMAALFTVSAGCPVDAYGLPPDGDGDIDADIDADADADLQADADIDGSTDWYGLPDSGADADIDGATDYYGLPDGDADADIDGATDYYGLPDGDADADIDGGADWYGLPDDADI